jgi:hypothetical protein
MSAADAATNESRSARRVCPARTQTRAMPCESGARHATATATTRSPADGTRLAWTRYPTLQSGDRHKKYAKFGARERSAKSQPILRARCSSADFSLGSAIARRAPSEIATNGARTIGIVYFF